MGLFVSLVSLIQNWESSVQMQFHFWWGIIVPLPFRWESFQFPSVFFCMKELMLIGIIGVGWTSLLAVGKHNCKLDIQCNFKLMILVSLLGTDSAGDLEGLEGCSSVLSFHFGLDRKYSNISITFVFCLIYSCGSSRICSYKCYSFVLTGSNSDLFRVGTPTVVQWLEVQALIKMVQNGL